jgi:hypothetical protein
MYYINPSDLMNYIRNIAALSYVQCKLRKLVKCERRLQVNVPALGNEPVCLEQHFYFLAKNRQQAALPKFSGENLPFSENQFARLFSFLRSESPQLCLLATFVKLLEKCIAS